MPFDASSQGVLTEHQQSMLNIDFQQLAACYPKNLQDMDAASPSDDKVAHAIQLLIGHAHEQSTARYGVGGIQQTDGFCDALRSGLDQLVRQLHIHISRISLERNTLVPVQSLPDELLSTILLFSLRSQDLSHDLRKLLSLASVCRSWKRLIDETPAFWGFATGSFSSSVLLQVISRSKNAQMDVEYRVGRPARGMPVFGIPVNETPAIEINPYMDIVLETTERWRSVHFMLPLMDSLQSLQKRPFPKLRDLSLISDTPYTDPNGLFVELVRQLRHVRLHSVSLRWEWGALSNLQTLDLACVPGPFPSGRDLLGMLRSSPGLRTLQLQGFNPDLQKIPQLVGDPIHLNQLAHLTLKLNHSAMRLLLALLRIPHCIRFVVEPLRTAGVTPAVLDLSMTHLLIGPSSLLNRSQQLGIFINDSRFSAVAYDNHLHLVFQINGNTSTTGTVEWLTRTLQRLATPPLLDLTLTIDDDTVDRTADQAATLRILRTTSTVTTLWVHNPPDAEAIMRALAEPITIDGVPHWPSPMLKDIRFSRCRVDLGVLLRMLRRRYGREELGEGEGRQPAALPVPLTRLRLEAREPNPDIQEMMALVGTERVMVYSTGPMGPV